MAEGYRTVIELWADVQVPSAPPVEAVELVAEESALLVLDMQKQSCSAETRPRFLATLLPIQRLLTRARETGMLVAHTLTRNASEADIHEALTPKEGEAIFRAGVDKFHNTVIEGLLCSSGVETVVLVGTSAHGAVLHTATGAAVRGLQVVVPLDGISASDLYAEQYTAWHLVNAPGTRRRVRLTTVDRLSIRR